MRAESAGFFLFIGWLLVRLVHSIEFLQQALSKELRPSSGIKECSHFNAACAKVNDAGDLI